MEYRKLGAAGVSVSPLCLGTMMFGSWGNDDEDECIRIIHRALDEGINFVDTANVYSEGRCEEIVGRALEDRRQQAVLATKVWGPMGPGPNERGLSRKAIQEQVEHSLRRLRTDVIDLYQIHRPDPHVPWEETLRALDDLVRQGKVRYIGCSTNHYSGDDPWQKHLPAWEIVETLAISERHGWERFVSLQPPYSLLRRVIEQEHLPMCARHDLGVMAWSPLEGGWLAGKYRKDGAVDRESPRFQRWIKSLDNPKFACRVAVVEKLLPHLEERDIDPAQFALAWTLDHPAVTSTIIGPRTMEQLEGCLGALQVEIDDEDRELVDRLVAPGTSVL